jgi:large subunit ribosomal protein L28
MSKKCDVCGKGKHVGGSITRRGMAKKKGGIGQHVVKNVKRTFYPNVQQVRVRTETGVHTIKACTRCIRSNLIAKA